MLIKVLSFVLNVLHFDFADSSFKTLQNTSYDLGDHTVVTSNNVFPYMAAIFNKSRYLCAGALIDESWVLTVADSLFLFRDSQRFIHVRLGSINYKKGGQLLPVKLIEFHPYFDDQKPEFDIALIQLPNKVRLTPNLNPIRIQRKTKEVIATHFIVTSWPSLQHVSSKEIIPVENINRRRMLQVAHLHPTAIAVCMDELEEMGVSQTNLMCLDQGEDTNPCETDVGAPVVFNGILWGIVSSWVSEDCDLLRGPTFVTMVAAPNITTWIFATLQGKKWEHQMKFPEILNYDEYDYFSDD